MEDAIVPSIKTTLEPHESNSAEIQDLCLFVFNEVGKWEAMKQLRKKYNAYWDGAGYLIDIKHKKEVEDFCKQYNLVCIEHDAPENINDLPYYDPIILLEQQLETKKREIKSLLYGTGVEYNDIDDLYNENIKKKLKICRMATKY